MSQAALGGFRNEDWVALHFNDHNTSPYGAAWLEAMGYRQCPGKVCAQTTRRLGFFNKADVLVLVDGNVEWISVKKFIANFNQVDKRWVGDYAKLWRMPDEVTKSLRMYCGEAGYTPLDIHGQVPPTRERRRFFMDELPDERQERTVSFLNRTKRCIVRYVMAGRGKGAARWMLATEELPDATKRTALVGMDAVVRHYARGPTMITRAGNLRLGRISIQRKGGDAGKRTAQMLQFKFKPRELFKITGARVFESQAPCVQRQVGSGNM